MIDDLTCLMYALAHDDAAEGPYDRPRTELLLSAAALIDLAARGRLAEDDRGRVTVIAAESTGDPVCDAVLRDAAGHDWKHLVRRHRKEALAGVQDRLAAAGDAVLREPRTPLGSRKLTFTDPAAPAAVRARVTAVLHADGPVGGVQAADAALLALAAAGGIRGVVSPQDRKARKDRIDACTARLADLAPGLEKAVRGLPMTMVAAQGGMGGS
jgi:Golgi phosphoprotein 3 (GPP34)